MKRLIIGSLALLFALPVLVAQRPAGGTEQQDPAGGKSQQGTTGGAEGAERVDRRAKEMRDNLGRVKQVKSHVRVQVRLANGNRLQGVVKDGRLVERVNELRFVDADATDQGAGIRLWYSGGTRNYVFVPFSSLAEYKILQRLSAKELLEIENELRMEEARKAELARQEAKMRQQAAKPEGEGQTAEPVAGAGEAKPDGKAEAKPDGKAEPAGEQISEQQKLQQEYFKLLQAYPPAQGWNAKKRDEIKRRFAVVGARPSESEQRFVDKFEDWLRACKMFGVDPDQQAEQDPGQGDKKRKK